MKWARNQQIRFNASRDFTGRAKTWAPRLHGHGPDGAAQPPCSAPGKKWIDCLGKAAVREASTPTKTWQTVHLVQLVLLNFHHIFGYGLHDGLKDSSKGWQAKTRIQKISRLSGGTLTLPFLQKYHVACQNVHNPFAKIAKTWLRTP